MSGDLFWPGLHRAGDSFTDEALLVAMTRVEVAWVAALERRSLAPPDTAATVAAWRADPEELRRITEESELGANPLIPLLARLRDTARAVSPEAGAAVHTGLTSQDVVDTALVLMSAEAVDQVVDGLGAQRAAVGDLVRGYGEVPFLARTLGQPAEVTTFGARLTSWERDLADAEVGLRAWRQDAPVQIGGAVGDRSALQRRLGSDAAAALLETAESLGLQNAAPWHTSRGPITRLGAALTAAATAWGHIANDVSRQCRPEVGELAEPPAPGRGSSSAMAHKRNPVLSVLLRRTAFTAPLLQAQLQLAAALSVEERSDGAWHTEWATLRDLVRRVLAGSHLATELLTGLQVHPEAMTANAEGSLS